MATAIAVYNSNGLIGRCDAKCHEAKDPHCDCICGGANHGVGEKQAFENTREDWSEWLDAYCKAHGIEEGYGVVPALRYVQLEMFQDPT